MLLDDGARGHDGVGPRLQATVRARGSALESSSNNIIGRILRSISLSSMHQSCVFKAAHYAARCYESSALCSVLARSNGRVTACYSSAHGACSVACASYSVGSGALVVGLPGLGTVFHVGDLEVASGFLVADLLGFGCCADVGFDYVAIGLVLQVDIRLVRS